MSRNTNEKAMVRGPRQNLKNKSSTGDSGREKPILKVSVRKSTKGNSYGALRLRIEKFPPDYNASPTYCCRRRFASGTATAITNQTFTLASGHDQFLEVINVAGLATCFVDMWRIKRIFVWCNNFEEHSTTVSILPVGADIDSNSFNDREAVFTCSSRGVALPGSMEISPSRNSPLGQWHETTTVNAAGGLFVMNCNYQGNLTDFGVITMDIEFDFVINMTGIANGYTIATATTTLGTLGGRQWASAGGGMNPLGVNVLG